MNDYRLSKFEDSIFLCGFMATGKSTIGRIISKKLNKPFKDLDRVITEKENSTVKELFELKGERYFREKEWEYLLDLTRNFKGVVALGGGALHNQMIVDHLKIHGLLVYIKTPLDIIVERVSRNTKRPIVLDIDGKIKSRETLFTDLNTLYSKRVDLYEQAQIILDSTGFEKKEEQAQNLIEKLKRYV